MYTEGSFLALLNYFTYLDNYAQLIDLLGVACLPQGFWETREHDHLLLGNKEQTENKTGNMGTKAYSREQVTPKSKKYF